MIVEERAMIELLTQPPPAEAITRMTAIDGVRIAPTALATQQGPHRRPGPEQAGAILVLQATFVDEARFREVWVQAVAMMEQLPTAPGFIRRFNFADGPHYTLIAFWHTMADAHAFFERDDHQAVMRELFRN